MKSTQDDRGQRSGPPRWPSSFKGKLLLAGWVALLALWIQFSIASVQELEFQAVALGAIVVVILLLGGLTVWAAGVQTRNR